MAGIKSVARSVLHSDIEKPLERPGFAAYRATVNVDNMRSDPDMSWLLEKPSLNIWLDS